MPGYIGWGRRQDQKEFYPRIVWIRKEHLDVSAYNGLLSNACYEDGILYAIPRFETYQEKAPVPVTFDDDIYKTPREKVQGLPPFDAITDVNGRVIWTFTLPWETQSSAPPPLRNPFKKKIRKSDDEKEREITQELVDAGNRAMVEGTRDLYSSRKIRIGPFQVAEEDGYSWIEANPNFKEYINRHIRNQMTKVLQKHQTTRGLKVVLGEDGSVGFSDGKTKRSYLRELWRRKGSTYEEAIRPLLLEGGATDEESVRQLLPGTP